jgi:TPR repeat protein
LAVPEVTCLGDDDCTAAERAQACELGDVNSCFFLGLDFASGEGVAADYEIAAGLFRLSCALSHVDGCASLGLLYQQGLGVTADDERAVQLFRLACDAGGAHGCTGLALAHLSGRGVEQDLGRARELLEQACQGGSLDGCGELARLHEQGPVEAGGAEPDLERAMALYELTCHGGVAGGCTAWGRLLLDGELPEADIRGALLFERACLLGDAEGCGYLGLAHLQGRGVERDQQRAAHLLDQACREGADVGCVFWAEMLRDGLVEGGGDEVLERAVSLFTEGCDGGQGRACHDLGLAYASGEGLEQDQEQALAHFERACQLGFLEGCRQGSRLQRDERPRRAVQLLGRACAAEDAGACDEAGAFLAMLPPEVDAASLREDFTVACDHGVDVACLHLGSMCAGGHGGAVEPGRAHQLWAEACQAGVVRACVLATDEDGDNQDSTEAE